jgi:hypothetical protein
MALSTYAELRDEVAQWLQRSDLSMRIPTFIDMATARFNRELRTPEMESRDTTVMTDEFVALPNDFLEMRYVVGDGVGWRYMNPIAFAEAVAHASEIKEARIYTLADMQLRAFPAPTVSEPVTVIINYIERIPPLVNASDTNWMLTDNPDVYLYGSLVQAQGFLHDDPRMATWLSMYKDAIGPLGRRKLAATGVVATVAGDVPLTGRGFNITTGSY